MMKKAERTKQIIIEKSAPIFNRKGIAGTPLSDVLEATGLAKGSLYVHFKDKDELAQVAVDYNLNLFFQKAEHAQQPYQTARQKFDALLDMLHDPLNHPIEGGCPMLNFGVDADQTNPATTDKVKAAMTAAQQYISAILKSGVKGGEFQKDWNVDEFATKVFAMLEGGVLVSRVMGSPQTMKTLITFIRRELDAHTI